MTLGTFWVAKRRHVSSADAVKHELKWGLTGDTWHPAIRGKSQSGWIRIRV